jgi:erythromycin esterase-like protein
MLWAKPTQREENPMKANDRDLAQAIAYAAYPLDAGADAGEAELELLAERCADARFVLIGEASHGTHEFYRLRARLTRHLIASGQVAAVAVEGDWPDAAQVNRCVRGGMPHADAVDALAGFRRFPAWMWRNADVLDFVGWLRGHNERHQPRVGFYGLDLYSLHGSMAAVIRYLDDVDPRAAARARERYACFDHFGEDPQTYGQFAGLGLSEGCQREVVAELIELQERRSRGEGHPDDAAFEAEQNARLVKNAEHYYRTMLHGHVESWNLRDSHMADTLDALARHLAETGNPGKIVVWAHNSHVGDARATQLGAMGELNLGQLVRHRHPGASFIIGFTTNTGSVTAASNWDGPAERRQVRPALEGSIEALMHASGVPAFVLPLDDLGEAAGALREPRLERAIGVIYRPETERQSHYFLARLPAQFDAIIHLDETRAVEPLERTSSWDVGEPAETYPSGL